MSKTAKRVLACVGFLLVGVLLTVLVSNLLGIAEWDMKKPNEDNLYQSATFLDKKGVLADGSDGVSVELTEDNEIKVKGTSEGALPIAICKLTLKANTDYVFDGSLTEGSNKTMYMTVTDGETVLAKSYRGPVEIPASVLTADTEVVIVLNIADEDVKTGVTLRPVLYKGTTADDAVEFWA